MTIKRTLTTLSIVTIVSLSLIGCGSDNKKETTPSTGGAEGYKAQFKAKSIGDQVEELMGGLIGIVTEVGTGKMFDPWKGKDTTLVESQFSWNSTMDFYNNIMSVKNVCDGGLEEIAERVDAAKTEEIEKLLEESLELIVAISDFDGDGKLTTSDLIANDGEVSFRNQIQNDAGRAKIKAAVDKLAELELKLRAFKPVITDGAVESDKKETAELIDNVIIKGYSNLGTEADKLATALTTLKTAPTAANVEAARKQWRATRLHWEAGEGHIFGPVDTLGVDPKVDSWPVDKTQLDGALSGWDAELSNIDGFPVTMKGFHAMEYLLFGDGATQESTADAATRLQTPVGDDDTASDKVRLGYLEAMGKSFAKDIKSLVDAWK